jgi:hypothetical protein
MVDRGTPIVLDRIVVEINPSKLSRISKKCGAHLDRQRVAQLVRDYLRSLMACASQEWLESAEGDEIAVPYKVGEHKLTFWVNVSNVQRIIVSRVKHIIKRIHANACNAYPSRKRDGGYRNSPSITGRNFRQGLAYAR